MSWPATYYDGKTSEAHQVSIRILGEQLIVTGANGSTLTHWPAADVQLTDKPGGGGPPRLCCGHGRDDRLILADEADLEWIEPHCPNLHRTTPGWNVYWKPVVLWGGGAVVSVFLLVKVLIPVLSDDIARAIPDGLYHRIGENVSAQVIKLLQLTGLADKTNPVCVYGAGTVVLDSLAARLAQGLDVGVPVDVTIVNSKIVNAMALPGGRIFVFRGLIDFALHGNEVAGVLAHEIGHVAKRHPMQQTVKQGTTSLLIGLLIGDITGGTAIAGMASTLINTSYSRDAEREADAIAVELMNRAGFSARQLGDFFERLQKKQGGKYEKSMALVSTHPLTAERIDAVRRDAARDAPAMSEEDWRSVKQLCK
ncbi:MAG: M48 family metallopeptidase [Rhodospirillales bacterium]|nr:M48 family metallopeptidase [Rhodospirillales bacterium]